jgi:hypothetical protein
MTKKILAILATVFTVFPVSVFASVDQEARALQSNFKEEYLQQKLEILQEQLKEEQKNNEKLVHLFSSLPFVPGPSSGIHPWDESDRKLTKLSHDIKCYRKALNLDSDAQ